MKRFSIILALVAVMGLASIANAAFVTLDTLTLSVANINCPGPYATVKVELNDNTNKARFTFLAMDSYEFGDGGAVAVNIDRAVNGTFGVVSADTNTSATLTKQAAGDEDGFGSFNTRFTSGSWKAEDRFTSATIILSGIEATNLNELLDPNFAAVHFRSPDGTRGFASVPSVPLPGAVLLFGTGLCLLTAFARRRQC